jgi:hypothetical protein
MVERIGEVVYRIGAGIGLIAAILGGIACVYSLFTDTTRGFTEALAFGLMGLVGGMLVWMVARVLLYAMARR